MNYVLVGETDDRLDLVLTNDEDVDGVTRLERDLQRRQGQLGLWKIVEKDDGSVELERVTIQ